MRLNIDNLTMPVLRDACEVGKSPAVAPTEALEASWLLNDSERSNHVSPSRKARTNSFCGSASQLRRSGVSSERVRSSGEPGAGSCPAFRVFRRLEAIELTRSAAQGPAVVKPFSCCSRIAMI